MSFAEITIHRCIGLRISRYYPKIANAITVEFLTEGEPVPILAFNLPLHITDKLMAILRDEDTTVSHDAPRTAAVVVEDEELETLLNEELEDFGRPVGGAAA